MIAPVKKKKRIESRLFSSTPQIQNGSNQPSVAFGGPLLLCPSLAWSCSAQAVSLPIPQSHGAPCPAHTPSHGRGWIIR